MPARPHLFGSRPTPWSTSASRTAVALMLVGALLLLATPAQAAFPGGNGKIAYASNEETEATEEQPGNPEGDFELFTINPDGTGQEQLTENACTDTQPTWSPNGEFLLYASDQLIVRQGEEPEDPDACEADLNIWLTNATGDFHVPLTRAPSTDQQPAWSSDGRRAVFSSNFTNPDRERNIEGDFELFRMIVFRQDGSLGPGGFRQLTDNAANDIEPNWNPQAHEIAFASDRDGDYEIFVLRPGRRTGPRPAEPPATPRQSTETQLTFNTVQDRHPNYAPDGEQITFARNQDLLPLAILMDFEVWKMNSDGSGQVPLTENLLAQDDQPAWSPDDTMITFSSDRGSIILGLLPDDREIFKMSQDGSAETPVTNNTAEDIEPDWQPLAGG